MTNEEPTADLPDEDEKSRSTSGYDPRGEYGQSLIGRTIGNYHVLREIGRGGMGVVYEAQQQNPKRIVALKVINPGRTSERALRRFEHEAQILARLQHPGIAQIYEAGTFDLGAGVQPFFAMEMVQGETLTRYARKRNLSTRDRLALIVKICQAVQHAHQKGVIHRDLKPGNILVVDDRPHVAPGESPAAKWEGQPKILDFGVARATDSDIQTTTLQTDIGQLVGTIPYMSPEQAAGDPNELDTRSDVYALGVVAYELLAGRLPYNVEQKMIHEAVRIIREDEPTRLSSINRTLRGDVEIIIGKALEKERERRYQSATDFASDIERYMRDEPIVARPPSAAYQFRKFARRNKALVGGVAAVLVVLVVGLIGMSILYAQTEEARADAVAARDAEAEQRRVAEQRAAEAIEARREAEEAKEAEAQRAEEVELVAEFQASQLADIETELMGVRIRGNIMSKRRAFMEGRGLDEEQITSVLAELEQSLTGVNFTNIALDALDENIFERALKAIDKQFEDQPLVKARLLQTVADTMKTLGLLERATAPQTQALELRHQHLGSEHNDTLKSVIGLARLLGARGMHEEAQLYWNEAFESRANLSPSHSIMTSLAIAHPFVEQKVIDPQSFRELLREWQTENIDVYDDEGTMMEVKAPLCDWASRVSAELFRQALLDDRSVDDEVLHLFPEPIRDVVKAAHQMHEFFGGELKVAELLQEIAKCLLADGRLDAAESYLREVLDYHLRPRLGSVHPQTLEFIRYLCYTQWEQKELAAAAIDCREVLDGRRLVLGDEHPDTLISISNIGSLMRELGETDEAKLLVAEAVETAKRVLPERHWHIGAFIAEYARTLAAMAHFDEAEERMLEAHAIFESALGPAHERTIGTIRQLADLYDAWHEAEPDSDGGYDLKAAQWRAKLPADDQSED